MRHVEIPLLRESAAFAMRLEDAARRFKESKYRFYRRVNWSHRYDSSFYESESACFQTAPEAYLAGQQQEASTVSDVYQIQLGGSAVLKVVIKVAAHWLFQCLGHFWSGNVRASGIAIYRKGYVDDIELVFDPQQSGVIRAIYPFPINARRQLRYLHFLWRSGYRFKLAGHSYGFADLWHFVTRRDVRSLQRLETRAQIRHAYQIAQLKVNIVQLSDEFDIGSLDFARTLARLSVHTVNSAHGIGKYFPVHAYQEFHVVTARQAEYYRTTRLCKYTPRILNDRGSNPQTPSKSAHAGDLPSTVNFVFLSQCFAGVSSIISENESRVTSRLAAEFNGSPTIRLFYRAHPNHHKAGVPKGFVKLERLDDVNGKPGTIFVSFFSTCQIDPAFKGRKLLLRGDLIFPEIGFDPSEPIVDVEELIILLSNWSAKSIDEISNGSAAGLLNGQKGVHVL